MPPGPAKGLARYLAAAYILLVAYASLYPFDGWHDVGIPLLEFLGAGWPRYYTGFDIGVNVAAYAVLGLLMVPALRPPLPPAAAVALTVLGGTSLSFGVEVLQNFLPTRVPSNLDLGSNALGTLLGALLGIRYARAFAPHGAISRWRERRIVRGRTGDLGLTLLTLWLLTQLNPEVMLFGNGDLRQVLGLPMVLGHGAELFFTIELLIAGCGVVAVGLMAWIMMREKSPWTLGALLLLALLVKALAWAVLLMPADYARWLTRGAQAGLLGGVAVLAAALMLPEHAQRAVAALALLAGASLVNLAPENPYLASVLYHRWQVGHFFNFNGLTRLACSLWPFLALAYLIGTERPPIQG